MVANNEIRCKTPPGIGHNHVWTIGVTSDTGVVWEKQAPMSTSYIAPSVSEVLGASSLPTRGGATVTLAGTNFSPYLCGEGSSCSDHQRKISDSAIIKYGRSLSQIEEFDCVNPRAAADTGADGLMHLLCETTPGVGAVLWWGISIGMKSSNLQNALWSQESNRFEGADTAYAVPSISSVESETLSTAGQEVITVRRTNFGLDPYPVEMMYGKYAASSCRVELGDADDSIICSSVEGIGFDHRAKVVVGGQTSPLSPEGEVVNYLPPRIMIQQRATDGPSLEA